jgi:hypothetical protein
VLAGVVVELGGAGHLGGHADDAVDDLFTGALTVQATSITTQPEHLPGAGEQAVIGGRDAYGALFGTPVSPVEVDGGVVGELRVGSRQQRLGSLQGEGARGWLALRISR